MYGRYEESAKLGGWKETMREITKPNFNYE